tara:strand:- start:1311 stop:1748 length:438 start_codon:yes stop_codon:yes gene_type:complete
MLNKYYIQDLLYKLLSQISYFYIVSKSNKKKIIDFFDTLPFFFFNTEYQSLLYDIIQRQNIKSYIDKPEHLKQLCYNIYSEFCKIQEIDYENFEEFYDKMDDELYSSKNYYQYKIKNRIHSYLFILIIIVFVLSYIYLTYKQDSY